MDNNRPMRIGVLETNSATGWEQSVAVMSHNELLNTHP